MVSCKFSLKPIHFSAKKIVFLCPIDPDQTELPDIFWDYRDKCAAQIPLTLETRIRWR